MTMQIWTNVPLTTLEMRTPLTVYVPEGNSGSASETTEPGLLILLHGLSGNNADWPSHIDLNLAANQHNLVIALPDGHRSFWVNGAHGLRYGDWVGVELPEILRRTLRMTKDRARTLIGGLSMGGYGAFRAAFDHPETYGGAFALSGTLDVAEPAFREWHGDLYPLVFGSSEGPRPEDDLIARLDTSVSGPLKEVQFFACCGTEDYLIEQNRRFDRSARGAGLQLEFVEEPGGHDYEFWANQWPIALENLLGRLRQVQGGPTG